MIDPPSHVEDYVLWNNLNDNGLLVISNSNAEWLSYVTYFKNRGMLEPIKFYEASELMVGGGEYTTINVNGWLTKPTSYAYYVLTEFGKTMRDFQKL